MNKPPPKGWQRERLKRRVVFSYGESLSAENRHEGEIIVFGSNGQIGTHNQFITKGKSIIIGRKGSSGKITWSDKECFPIDTTFYVDKTTTHENLRWVYYLLMDMELDKINLDSAVPGLNREQAHQSYVKFPSTNEQRCLVAYLDKTCDAIDKAIEAKQKQLEILDALRKSIIHKAVTRGLDDSVELKDSGVEWLGRIPSTWHSQRIKDVAKLSPGFSVGKPTMTDLGTVIPMEAVSESGKISTDQVQEFNLISGGLTNFEVGDIIFAKITPCMENGKGAYITALPTKYAFGSTEFHVLRPSDKVDGKFLYYYTFNSVYRKYAEKNMTGAAGQKRVSSNFLKYTRIYLPNVMAQRHIADYLDEKCSELTELQVNIEKQISTLEQYRKSLIHECVTGKRRSAG